jgi:hypothetical protein
MPGEDLERLAADPTTALTTLQELARDHPELRPAIAANPSTYPALLEWLAMLGVPAVDAALAERAARHPDGDRDRAVSDAAARDARTDAAAADRDARTDEAAGAPPEATSVLPAQPAATPALPPSYPPRRATASRPADPAPSTTDRAEPPTVTLPAAGGAPVLPPVIPPAAPARAPRVQVSPEPARSPTAERAAGGPGTPAQGVAVDVPATAGESAAAGTGDVGPGRGAGGPGTGDVGPGAGDERPTGSSVDATLSAGGRLPRWLLPAGIAVIAFIFLAWAFGPTTGANSTAPPDAGPGVSAAPSDPTAAAGAALAALPDSTSCGDVDADAQVFADYGAVASTGDSWQDPASADVVMNALVGLQDACDPAYALAVSNTLVDGGATPAAVRTTLTTAGEWLEPARPAPADAQQRDTFVSPTGNIACALGDDTATCTITERSFEDPQSCGPGPVTLVVGAGGDARPDCAAPAAAGGDGLAYDQSVTAGYFACLSELDGVTCWSTLTGRGFTVARAGFSTF